MIIPAMFMLTACGEHKHDFGDNWKSDGTHHWRECECGERFGIDSHFFIDGECDFDCEICGYEREASHDYNYSTYMYDEESHWHECVNCYGRIDEGEHSFQQRYNANGHWQECTTCHVRVEFSEHHPGDWEHSIFWHFYICQDCNAQLNSARHTYDNDCDTTCNDGCGYIRNVSHNYASTWTFSDNSHWHECSKCGGASDTAEHNFTNGVCSDCGHIENTYFEYNSTTESYKLTDGRNITATSITIPSTFNDGANGTHPVTIIGARAFENCSNLTSVTMPASIVTIGTESFHNCTSLTSVTLGDGVTRIGVDAFYNTSLTKVNFLGTIDQWAQITFDDVEANPTYYTKALYINDIKVTEVNLTTATKVSAYAFYKCSDITSVVIPDGADSIGGYAFYSCRGLTSVTIPNSVTSIGYSAFSGCTGLTSITIPDSVTSIGAESFYNCTSLTSITLSNELSSLGRYAFAGCIRLTSATVPNGVTTISEGLFYGCTNLTSVTLGNAVTNLSDDAFGNCTGLTKVNFLGTIDQWAQISFETADANPTYYARSLYINNTKVTTVNLTTATKVSAYAFYNNKDIISVTIPASVTSIGSSAFNSCYKLIEVYNLSALNITLGETTHGYVANYAKDVYTSLTTQSKLSTDSNGYIIYTDGEDKFLVGYTGSETVLTLPSDITEIYDKAFYNCTSITSVTIPASVTKIGYYAFYNCTGLTKVNFLGTIDQWAQINFSKYYANPIVYTNALYLNNQLVTQVNLTTATKISAYAFSSYEKLTSVTIGNSVTIIGEEAFKNCTNLTSATMGSNVATIEANAFSSCSKLTSITLGSGVTTIGEGVFRDCRGLKSVIIGNNLERIEDYAFSGCGALASVTIGTKVKYIGEQAFESCGLTSIVIPDSVLRIEEDAFWLCRKLTSVIIGSGIRTIRRYAFHECSNLTYAYYKGSSTDWDSVTVNSDNSNLTGNLYFYVANEQDVPADNGNYWHYDTDGVTPVAW